MMQSHVLGVCKCESITCDKEALMTIAKHTWPQHSALHYKGDSRLLTVHWFLLLRNEVGVYISQSIMTITKMLIPVHHKTTTAVPHDLWFMFCVGKPKIKLTNSFEGCLWITQRERRPRVCWASCKEARRPPELKTSPWVRRRQARGRAKGKEKGRWMRAPRAPPRRSSWLKSKCSMHKRHKRSYIGTPCNLKE